MAGIIRSLREFISGAYVALSERLVMPVSVTRSARLNGRAIGTLLSFVIHWLAVSSIFFCVFRYANKVIEWASR